ncbi:MAG TPA: nitroreductase family protein [Stellaceae bacterium]|nr:nitroreductase family protein [Stellaceae bacterium]
MTRILDDRSLDSLFRAARSCRAWLDKPVSDAIIEAVWELAKLPPTSTGAHPARIVFIRSLEAKQQLLPALTAEDRASAAAAPVNAILGYDSAAGAAALRDATLQAGYLILAARAIGLDCAPLALADPGRVDRKFFAASGIKGSFVCNLGYGDPGAVDDATTPPSFEEACRIV